MALSSYPKLNWSPVRDPCLGFVPTPPQAPQYANFPSYSSINAATCSVVNNARHAEAVKADPSFFNKGYSEYGVGSNAVPADDYGYTPYPGCYNTCAIDDYLLDPAPTCDLSSIVDNPLSLAYCYGASDQMSCGPGILGGLNDVNSVNSDQFYSCQAPAFQLPDCPYPCDLGYLDQTEPYPTAQLPKKIKVDDYVEHSMPRTRRVSAQSLAARERRKKISDKTQQLGKLIPGGTKMNTAEMLQSAFSYVKFLQSQVRILEFMDSLNPSQESGLAEKTEKDADDEKGRQLNLLRLLALPQVQERLYKEGSCIIPRSLVGTLIPRHPHLQDQLNQLL